MGRDDLKIPMDLPEFMLAPHSMTDAKYNSWGSGVPYVGQLLEAWTMRSSTLPASCLPSLFRYILNLLFFSSFLLPSLS